MKKKLHLLCLLLFTFSITNISAQRITNTDITGPKEDTLLSEVPVSSWDNDGLDKSPKENTEAFTYNENEPKDIIIEAPFVPIPAAPTGVTINFDSGTWPGLTNFTGSTSVDISAFDGSHELTFSAKKMQIWNALLSKAHLNQVFGV